MIVTCMGCNTSFNLEDERVKQTGSKVRCSVCKSIFVVYPPVAAKEQDLAESIEEQEVETPRVESEDLSLSDSEDISFSEIDEAVEEKQPEFEGIAETDKGQELPEDQGIDFSDFSENLEKEEPVSSEVSADEDSQKPKLSDSEDIDFSELEKMLENGEISFDNLLSEDDGGKIKFSDTEEIDLSDIDAAIDNIEDADIEEAEEETRELKFDFGDDQESQILKASDPQDLDLSDLESMLDLDEIPDSSEIKEKTADITPDLDFELEHKTVEQKSEDEADALDFSDLEKMLETETDAEESVVNPVEENFELSLEKDQTPGSHQELKFEDTVSLDNGSLDFSDFEGMLETDKVITEPGREPAEEKLELSLEVEEPTGSEKKDVSADTISFDDLKLEYQADEVKQEDALEYAEEYEITEIQEPEEAGAEEETIDIASVQQEAKRDETESERVTPPPIKKKFFGKFLLIFGIILALLLCAGAFIYYNPFGIEIPVFGKYIESKVDKSGNLKITPMLSSLKGDYIDTKSGTAFVITGLARNDYKHPRSNIKVMGKTFQKGRVLSNAESVFCGNIISEQDLLEVELPVLKKRLQNKFGIKNSNVNVKPGGTIPFMIIFENPSPDLDEFIVEAQSSTRE